VPQWIREVIESHSDLRFDRAHFMNFGSSSLDIEFVYFVNSPEYNLYMDRQQSVYLALMERFERESVEFAYPVQVTYNRGQAPGLALPRDDDDSFDPSATAAL